MTGIAELPLAAEDRSHNLPVQLTSFIGRDAEMTQVRQLLAGSRLMTLTGAGGVGKTRLALEIAATELTEFPAGVWQVDLAPLTEASLIPVTVARALGLTDAPGRSTMAMLTSFIGARRMLVVLDNCEHLLESCALLAEELLHVCPGLVILATSREPVGVGGETIWRVPSLSVDGAAMELFADRGQQARAGFAITPENAASVTEICRRLDGIPLAIELAAARLRAFSPAEIASGLHDRFRLLTGGSRTTARRQQTLRASVDWSHALLTDPERILFRRLATFAGGFDLEAAEAVGADEDLRRDKVLDLLALLVDKSLVAAEESDGFTRYRLLETVRQYALEKLADSGEADQVRTRHRGYYTALASGLDSPGAGGRRHLIRRLETEIDNVRTAFAWSLELSETETALRLASSMQRMWLDRYRAVEGVAWLDRALAIPEADAEPVAPAVRVRAVVDAIVLDAYTDTPLRRMTEAREALALARQLEDPALLTRALVAAELTTGWLAADGRPYLAEAIVLARHAGDSWTLARILGWQTFAAVNSGDLAAARSAGEEGLALAEQTGDGHCSRVCRTWLSVALIGQGRLQQATSMLAGLVAEADAERVPAWKASSLACLGHALAYMGQPAEARAVSEASMAIADDFGSTTLSSLGALCMAAMASGDVNALHEASEAMQQRASSLPEFGFPWHSQMADAHLAMTNLTAARQFADQALAKASRLGLKYQLMLALLASARVAAAAGEAGRAHDEAYQALSIGRGIESQIGIIDALECLASLTRNSEEHRKAARLLGAADALRDKTGYVRFRLHEASYDAAVLMLRTSLGAAAFDQARDEGAALTPDEALTYALRGRGERSRPSVGWPSLTPSERDVARLVAEGLANKDIATQLFVSPRTVQTHLTHIYGKLGVTSRVQLAQRAARQA